jgi:hypothetical protein
VTKPLRGSLACAGATAALIAIASSVYGGGSSTSPLCDPYGLQARKTRANVCHGAQFL